MKLTYKQLAAKLKTLSEEQLNQDVTVSLDISQEAIPVKDICFIKDDDFLADVLDENHLVLTIDF